MLMAGVIFTVFHRSAVPSGVLAGKFDHVQLSLDKFSRATPVDNTTESLKVNGQLQVDGSVILAPTSQPDNPLSGQLYYDKDSKHLAYYDGQQFIDVAGGTTNITNVLSGAGTGVRLQSTSPGTQQNGNLNISGVAKVGSLKTTVIDSDGGTLYINPAEATVQQTVVTGTPATAGLVNIGSLTEGPGWANELIGTKVTLGAVGGTATSITAYYTSGTAGDHIQVGLYADDGDIPSKPGSLLAASAIVAMNTNGFTTVPIPTTNLDGGATYWLVINTDSATAIRAYNGGSQSNCFISKPFGFMPDPFSTQGCFPGNNVYTMYLNYQLGAGLSGTLSQASMVVGPTGQVLFQNAEDSTTAFKVQNAAGTTTILNIDTQNGRVGIGKTTPAYKLDVAGGDVNLSNGRSLRYSGSQVLSVNGDGSTVALTNFNAGGEVSVQSASFVVQDSGATHQSLLIDSSGAATFSNRVDSGTAFQIQNAANSATILAVDTTNRIVTVTNLAVTQHIITSGSTPGIAAGAAACTTPTVSVSGNDTSGTITVTTGTGCAASGPLATLTFANVFGAAPRVILTPGSSAALSLGAYVDNATVSTANFTLGTNTTPANTTTYQWNYMIVQ